MPPPPPRFLLLLELVLLELLPLPHATLHPPVLFRGEEGAVLVEVLLVVVERAPPPPPPPPQAARRFSPAQAAQLLTKAPALLPTACIVCWALARSTGAGVAAVPFFSPFWGWLPAVVGVVAPDLDGWV